MLTRSRLTVIIAFVLSLFLTFSAGAVPHEMNYQGKVTGAGGIPLDGNYDMKFSLYNDPDDGSRLWNEEQSGVPITDGVFNVSLGAVLPLSEAIFAAGFLGLEVEIYNPDSAAWEILSPRQRLTSTAYSFQAENAQTIGGYESAYFAPVGHEHSGEDTTSGTVDEARIDPDIARDTEITWSNLHDIPPDIADGDDGIITETDPTITESSIKDGVSWGEISGIPAGFADGVDDGGGITTEIDPQVGSILEGYIPYWSGSDLSTSGVFGDKTMTGPPLWDIYWKIGIGTTDPAANLDVVTDAGSNIAIRGENSVYNHSGKLGTTLYGAIGTNANGTYGILGWGSGVFGYNSSSANEGILAGVVEGAMGKHAASQNYGQLGRSDYGAYGLYNSSGNWGALGAVGYGAYGLHNSSGNWGALGAVGTGVEGRTTSSSEWHTAVYGKNEGQGAGVYGWSQNHWGTVGVTLSTNSSDAGVWAVNNGTGPGLIATAGSEGYAGKFIGSVAIISQTTDELLVEIGEGLDYAEGFDVTEKIGIKPGAVLVIDPNNPGRLSLSSEPYDTKVAGIVAGGNSLGSGVRLGAGQFDHDVALAGRVYCNVETNESAIKPGDLLTTSPIPGYAMKVLDSSRAQGAILGKAMQGLAKGEINQVLVLVSLQ